MTAAAFGGTVIFILLRKPIKVNISYNMGNKSSDIDLKDSAQLL